MLNKTYLFMYAREIRGVLLASAQSGHHCQYICCRFCTLIVYSVLVSVLPLAVLFILIVLFFLEGRQARQVKIQGTLGNCETEQLYHVL